MFTVDEACALVASVRMAQVWQDFRSFRLNRMARLELLQSAAGRFADEPGKTLADYLRRVAPPEAIAHL